jgi:hypothetical protein
LIHQHPERAKSDRSKTSVCGQTIAIRIDSGKGVLGLLDGIVAVYFEVRSISHALNKQR